MNWTALSAIGTTLATIVGIVGIWLNLWDKTRKIQAHFEMVPNFKVYLSNNSLRTIVITKMICSINTHVFHVEYFEGLSELTLPPATTQNINIIKQDVYRAYCKTNMSAICTPAGQKTGICTPPDFCIKISRHLHMKSSNLKVTVFYFCEQSRSALGI